jgi:hypothetical protein
LRNKPVKADSTAISRLASWQIILGLLPPNSRVTLLRFLVEQFYMILRPTGVDPVNAILSTKGDLTK